MMKLKKTDNITQRWMKKMEQRMARVESWFNDKESNKIDGNDFDGMVKEECVPVGQVVKDLMITDHIRVKTHNLALYISKNEKNYHMPIIKKTINEHKIDIANIVINLLYDTDDV